MYPNIFLLMDYAPIVEKSTKSMNTFTVFCGEEQQLQVQEVLLQPCPFHSSWQFFSSFDPSSSSTIYKPSIQEHGTLGRYTLSKKIMEVLKVHPLCFLRRGPMVGSKKGLEFGVITRVMGGTATPFKLDRCNYGSCVALGV